MREILSRRFFKELRQELKRDNVVNGAAALAYYLMLAIFPAAIFLLTLLPYLPIANLNEMIMGALGNAMPGEAATMFSGTVQQVTSQRQGGLLSFGLLMTVWAASSGVFAIMQQLNITYDVEESRPFWKVRGKALLLTVVLGLLVPLAFGLIVFGGQLESLLVSYLGDSSLFTLGFRVLQWAIVAAAVLFAFAITYYWGPDVRQKFRFVTPGSIVGTLLLVAASLGFKFYVSNFGNYGATYGSIGAVIVLMLWLNIMGLVLLLGSEINALYEHYTPHGKDKGEREAA